MLENAKSWARRQGAPITVSFLVSVTAASLLIWFLAGAPLQSLAFTSLARPWTVLTYPWAYLLTGGFGIIGLVFLWLWMLSVGGTVERDLGQNRFLAFMAIATVLPALAIGVLGPLLGGGAMLAGPWITVGALTVAWATRNPNSPIMLYGILPLAAKWIAVITVAGTLFGYGFGNPMIGVLACLGYAFAYAFAAGKIPGFSYARPYSAPKRSKADIEREEAYYDDVLRRERERDERERLRKLFENSLKDDK